MEIPGGGCEGYHVLKVQDHSPGHKAGLEPFFDFIVAIGETNERLIRLVCCCSFLAKVVCNIVSLEREQ